MSRYILNARNEDGCCVTGFGGDTIDEALDDFKSAYYVSGFKIEVHECDDESDYKTLVYSKKHR